MLQKVIQTDVVRRRRMFGVCRACAQQDQSWSSRMSTVLKLSLSPMPLRELDEDILSSHRRQDREPYSECAAVL